MRIESRSSTVEKHPSEPPDGQQTEETRLLNERIADYMANGEHDEWTVQTARRIFEEDAEFFAMIGDR